MAITAFPEPADLEVSFVNRIGDSNPKSFNQWTVDNPHPGYGKDPNILNEFGHTKYPMWVKNSSGILVIVNNAEEETELKVDAKLEAKGWA